MQRHVVPSSDPCASAMPDGSGGCVVQGRRRREGDKLFLQWHQGGHTRPAEVGARDLLELEDSLGHEALLQPRSVRGGPQTHRGVLQRPRVSRRARDVVRRQAERHADGSQHHGQHLRRASRSASSGSRSSGFEPLPEQHRSALENAAAAQGGRSRSIARSAAGQPGGGARRAQGSRLSLRVGENQRQSREFRSSARHCAHAPRPVRSRVSAPSKSTATPASAIGS